jgi:4-amino-4-deoxychorismate lyase
MHALITCLNGEFLPAHLATIPLSDRGARFGDGVFETIAIHEGVPYQWELHMARLREGLAALRIPVPTADLQESARTLLHKNNARDGFLRISISRGGESAGYLPLDADAPPRWAMEHLAPRTLPATPARLFLSSYRKPSLAALPVNHKLSQGVNSTIALLEAQENGCNEAVFRTEHDLVCSAAAANIFWIVDEKLFTPTLNTGCLNGTTRAAILRLSPLATEEVEAPISKVASAEAVFLTNCRVGLLPVQSLHTPATNWDSNHPAMSLIQQKYREDITDYINNNSVYWNNRS